MKKRIGRDGFPEYEYVHICAESDRLVEKAVWSPLEFLSRLDPFYVPSDDPDGINARRAQMGRKIADQANNQFLESFSAVDPVETVGPPASSKVVRLHARQVEAKSTPIAQ